MHLLVNVLGRGGIDRAIREKDREQAWPQQDRHAQRGQRRLGVERPHGAIGHHRAACPHFESATLAAQPEQQAQPQQQVPESVVQEVAHTMKPKTHNKACETKVTEDQLEAQMKAAFLAFDTVSGLQL